MSENSSLLSAEDSCSERVRFDDNVSFIDERGVLESDLGASGNSQGCTNVNTDPMSIVAKIHKVGIIAISALLN